MKVTDDTTADKNDSKIKLTCFNNFSSSLEFLRPNKLGYDQFLVGTVISVERIKNTKIESDA